MSYYRTFRAVVMIIHLHCLSSTPCIISESSMICKGGEIPINLSEAISELYLEDYSFLELKTLEHVRHIRYLHIIAKEGNVTARCFYQFSNLYYLGIHIKELINIDRKAFEGLTKLEILDLSLNPKLHERSIADAMNSENMEILPKLVHLNISRIKTALLEPVNLDEYFIISVTAGRTLRSLDISHLNILSIDFYLVRPICKTVEYINLTKSVIGSASNFWLHYACKSIRKIDLSGMVLPVLRTQFSFQSFGFFCQSLIFFEHLEIVLLNYVNTEQDIFLTNYSLEMSACPVRFQKVWFPGNKARWLNISVHLHETTAKELNEINASDNGMEYISPSALQPSRNLVLIDFSKNKLHIMQELYTDAFEKLFWAQGKLEYLYLSHNGLKHISMNLFSKNKFLKIIDISHNNIDRINFSIAHLVHLEKLLANNNKIHYIEPYVRNVLKGLLLKDSKKNYGNKNGSLNLYLKGNRFDCKCDKTYTNFIEWLHESKVIDAQENITCILDGDIIDIRSAPTLTEYHCRIESIKKTAMISVPIVASVLVTLVIITVRVRRWHRKKVNIRRVINKIEMGTFAKPYLAFLSYCSENADLVLHKIYPKLHEHLADITHSNQNLVCIGDKQFRPGFSVLCEVMRCVEESSVIVAVISRNYCQKRFCMIEIKEACEQNKPVIMLMVEHVEKELMDDFLQKIFDRYTHATWKPDTDGGHIEPDWKIFCKAILQLSLEQS